MGANSTQAVAITLFLIAFTLLAGALAGGGVPLAIAFLILLGVSLYVFMKVKPLEETKK